MKQGRNRNAGRNTMGTAVAKSGVAPRSLGTSAMKQTRDSGGNIFNPVQKPKSNILAAAKKVPVAGNAGRVHPSLGKTGPVWGPRQRGYPGVNAAAAGTPIEAPGGGKVTKKVAGYPKFYGR